jgi:ribosomal protein S27AE
MVFCKECQQKVEDCPHFVPPIIAKRIAVFDEKVKSLAYDAEQRILEIAFKSGQIWQLSGVPSSIYQELCDSTISSFLKFIAQRYKAAPVKTVTVADVPETEKCPKCGSLMAQRHRTGGRVATFVRVLWSCSQCNMSEWRSYGQNTDSRRRSRWH